MKKTYVSLAKNEFKIFENMLEGITVYKLIFKSNGEVIDGIIEYMNPATVETMDLNLDDAIGKSATELLGSDFIKPYLESINEFFNTGKFKLFEVYYPPTVKYFLVSGFDMHDDFFAIIRIDITEQKEIQNALKQSEERYHSLFKNNHAAMLLIDPETGYIVDANPAACSFYGYKSDEITKLKITDFNILGEEKTLAEMQKAKSEEKKYFLFQHRLSNGEIRDVEVYSGPITVENKKILYSIIHDVTVQKKAEEEVRKTRDHLEELVEERTVELEEAYESLKDSERGLAEAQRIAHLGNWEWNIVTNELYWSDEIYRIFGCQPQEFGATYDAFLNYVHPEDREYVNNKVKEALNGNPYNIDHRIILTSGKERIVHEQGEVTFHKENPVKMVGTVQDVTEQRRAEEQTRRLASIVESSEDAIFSKNLNGVIESWNRGAKKIYGYEASEIMGKHISILMNPQEWDKVSKFMEKVQEGKTITHYEGIRLRKDGSEFNVSVTLSPIRDSKGNVTSISVIARDVTERKKAEEDLKRSETILQEATRLSKVGAYEWDIKKDKFIFSPEWRRIHGIKEKSLSSKELIKITHSEDVLRVQNAMNEALEGKKQYNIEYRIINQINGEMKYIHALGTIIKDEEGNSAKMYGVAHDITESKLAFIERENLIDELRRSNDELQQFAYITSHDLQEPLLNIASYAQLLEKRYKGQLDSDADEFIEFMVNGAIRMKQQIKGLLDYFRVGTRGNEFKNFNAEDALDAALSNLHSSIGKNKAEVTYDNLPVISADESQIRIVFQNLIGNAIKFRKKDENPKIHISVLREENEWIFSVSDNSIGMEQEYTDKIFEIFRRLHPIGEYKGAGIGLAIVKRIIDRHEGRIWVESSLGEGSTFYFTIPIKMNE